MFWEAACDPGGFAWDDTGNNRAFLGQTIGATLNGASIYFVARNSPNKYPGFADKLDHFLNLEGSSGRFHFVAPRALSIMEYSPNKEAAAEYIRWTARDDNFSEFMSVNKGYVQGVTPKWENHPVWKSDPAIAIFATNPRYGRSARLCWSMEPAVGGGSGEIHHRRHVRSCSARRNAKDIVAWGQKELENVYRS